MTAAPYLNRLLGLLTLLAAIALGGCGLGKEQDKTINWTPEQLYADARDEMASGNYTVAIKQLERLESRYPFGRWAQQAQIDIAYANYKDGERVLALTAIERFIKLHPNHPALDYVLYLKGLVNFNEQQGLLARFGGQDLSERDLKASVEAFDAFKEVVKRFPDSKYAPDAEARLRYLINNMAGGELHIARHYYLRGAYVAAANRAQGIVGQYPDSPAVEEALYIMARSFEYLGLDAQSADAQRVLDKNFPNSVYMAQGIRSGAYHWWEIWR